jgi:TonB family protein
MGNEILVACAVKGTLVLTLALFVTAVLRRASAASRHLAWTVAFAALLLLPALSRVTPDWTSSALPASHAQATPLAPIFFVAAESRWESDWLFYAWLLGAISVFARFAIGTVRIWRRARTAEMMPIDGPQSGVQILDGGAGVMPMTWGILRPVILLPSDARGWPAERLRAVLLHETAHVARRDCLTLTIAELGLALYWFHPLAWWGASRMRRDREQACDDRVLAAGVGASDYAGNLVEIARRHTTSIGATHVAPAMALASNLELRLRAILDPHARRGAVSARVAAVVMAMAFLALLPLASLTMQGQGSGLIGSVYDASGGRVPDASISVVNSDTGSTQTAASDPAGNYSFPNLSPGRYQVIVSSPGFSVYARQAVTVPGTLEVILSLGQITESVVVSGRRSQTPAPNPAPRRIRVGGNVQAAKLLDQPRPAYPPQAEAAGIQGRVLLQAVIDTNGDIRGSTVLSSPDMDLANAALEAVRRWRYQATLLNGHPVEVITTISVNFQLN